MTVDTGGDQHWLVVAEEAFVPADSGGRVESLNLIRAAAAAGIRLHVIVPGIDERQRERHRAALPGVSVHGIRRRGGPRAHVTMQPYIFASRPIPARLPGLLAREHAVDPYTAVVAVSFRVAHIGTRIAESLRLPLLVRPHNVESGYFRALAASTRSWRRWPYRLEAWRLGRAEQVLHRSPRVTLFADIAKADADWRRLRTTTSVLHVPPFLPAQTTGREVPPGSDGAPRVLFLGSLDNANNQDAIRWFGTESWPGVLAAVPGAELEVVGRRVPTGLGAELIAAGARIVADVPTTAPHLEGADVFVNPVRGGAGINIKLIEAMAAGLPVVTTEVGARGLHWTPGRHLVVADTAEEFRDAVVRLLRDEGERRALGEAGRRFVRDELNGARHVQRLLAGLRAAELR